jgi:hypothetical protein
MLPLAPFVVLLLVLLSRRAVAQHVYNNVEEGWVLPDGRDSDFDQTFINEKTLAVAWEGWNSSTTDGSLGLPSSYLRAGAVGPAHQSTTK